jgi:hypothetical protein
MDPIILDIIMNTQIQLLDGKFYNRKELLSKMLDDDFYYDFMHKFAFSSSSIKLLLDSPKTYYNVMKYGSPETQALRDGYLLHLLLLTPEYFEKQIFVDVQSKNTKKFKLAKEEHGVVYTIKEKNDAERLVEQFYRNEPAMQMIKGCQNEYPGVGLVQGKPFRAKADVLCDDYVCDIKTTSNLKNFEISAYNFHYDVQAYVYTEIFDRPDFRFVVIDKGSKDIGISNPVSKEFIQSGRDKVAYALDIYEKHFETEELELDDYYIEINL